MSGIIKKIFKLFAYLVLVLVIFVAAVTGIFIATFDANEYKQDLTDLVREQSGRDLQFYGDVSLTIYPALGMELGALSFSNASGFGDQPMIKVNKVSISVDVASLIAFSPEVDQLVLSDLDINLQKNKNGVTNWDDLLKPETESTATETTPSDTGSGESMKISGAFGGLNIQKTPRRVWNTGSAISICSRVASRPTHRFRCKCMSPFRVAAKSMQIWISIARFSTCSTMVALNSMISHSS